MQNKTLALALVATTVLGGAAFAADQSSSQQAMTPPPGHAAVVKDFGKLSADGVRAYQDLTLARLAIFDGKTADAKKYVADADAGFDKAKGDETVFTEAEATMRSHMTKNAKSAAAEQGDKTAAASNNAGASNAANTNDVNTPVAWLPVDGTVILNEDYTTQPAKAKAVADANASLAKGDKAGAMEKLKLAEVDTAVSLAVVPLQQTISDVDQAKQLIDSGKYYEGSQKLKAVQDATVITVVDTPAVPAKAAASKAAPATH